MAQITWGAALGFHGKVTNFIDFSHLSPVFANGSGFTLADPSGDQVKVVGSGFTYSGVSVTGGTVSGVSLLNSASQPFILVAGLSLTAANVVAVFASSGGATVGTLLMAGNDFVIGSAIGDYIYSGAGNDTIKAGGGADFVLGQGGNDVLWGGLGPDRFVFAAHNGQDKIMDFHDAGLVSDDKIAMTQAMFAGMTTTETSAGVTLHLSATDTVFVAHWSVAQLDSTDFFLI